MNTTQDASGADALPEISNETLKRIETAVFADIAADRFRTAIWPSYPNTWTAREQTAA